MKALFRFTLLMTTCAALTAAAQDFPSRPLRAVVPYPAGSGPDLTTRALSQSMSATFGKPVVVENRGGGAGLPAVNELMNAPADGYTLLIPDSGHWSILPVLRSKLSYDPVRDFAPVGLIYSSWQFVLVPADAPYKNLQELVAAARAKPGKMQYGTIGLGGVVHLIGEAFRTAAGLDVQAIAYQGSPELVSALLRGDIPYAVAGYGGPLGPAMRAGRLRPLAVSTRNRAKQLLPDVPPVKDALGIADFDFAASVGMVARSGTPAATIERLSSALNQALNTPEMAAFGGRSGFEVTPSTPAQMGEAIRNDLRKFAQVVKDAKISIE